MMAKVGKRRIVSKSKQSKAKAKKPKAKVKKAKAKIKTAKPKLKAPRAAQTPPPVVTGTCTVTVLGVSTIRRHYTEQACAAWAGDMGGTYDWVADKS